MTIDVLLVDDQELVRTGLRRILEGVPDFRVVGEAPDGAAAVEQTRLRRPDVVVMDIRMPGTDGLEGTRRIAALPEDVRARVLILTTFDLDRYVFEALRAGASGFLLKDAPADQLIDGIRALARGEGLLGGSITKRLIERFAAEPSPEARTRAGVDELTPRELEVLELIARGDSNAEIAAALVISEQTVKTHVASILMKLHLRDRVQAVVLAYECGLVRPGARTDLPGRPIKQA